MEPIVNSLESLKRITSTIENVSEYAMGRATETIIGLRAFQPDRIWGLINGTLIFSFRNSSGDLLFMHFKGQKEKNYKSVSSNIKTVLQHDLLDEAKIQDVVGRFLAGEFHRLAYSSKKEYLVISYE